VFSIHSSLTQEWILFFLVDKKTQTKKDNFFVSVRHPHPLRVEKIPLRVATESKKWVPGKEGEPFLFHRGGTKGFFPKKGGKKSPWPKTHLFTALRFPGSQ